MSHDPYQTPQAGLELPLEIEFPEKVLRRIKYGWLAACISGILSLGYLVLALYSGEVNYPDDAWYFIDPVLVLILAYGIYIKSRVAAIILLVFDGGPKVAIAMESAMAVETIYIVNVAIALGAVTIVLLYLYFVIQGMIGTFQYQKIQNTHYKRMQSDAAKPRR